MSNQDLHTEELKAHWETTGNIRWITRKDVRAFDKDGNELEIPFCEKCECHKMYCSNKDDSIWICPICKNKE